MRAVGRGFTIVEVSIFLAVTGLLFISITVGVQNSIFQQRYNDAVQGFADLLRNVYSSVLNVQSLGGGNSDLATYGKMIVFGGDGSSGEQKIRIYSVVGNADVINKEECDGLYNALNCAAIHVTKDGGFAGVVEEYKPRWGTKIQKIEQNPQPSDFEGAVLIVRDPFSGRVYTMVRRTLSNVNDAIPNTFDDYLSGGLSNSGGRNDDSQFQVQQVDFCVNPNGDEPSNRRADVRIIENASNASGVEIIMDSDNNQCRQSD